MTLHLGPVALGSTPRIVAAGGEAEVAALARAADADAVELRADLFDTPTPARIVDALRTLRAAPRPIILTVRREDEGGRAMTDAQREAIYDAAWPLVDAIDVESASTSLLAALAPRAKQARVTLILSTHDLRGTPTSTALHATVRRSIDQGADVTKIATTTTVLDDVRTLLEVTLAHRATGIATMGMGSHAAITRVALFAAGSLFTYASVGAPTAPGQLAVTDLRALLSRLYPPPPIAST